MAQYTYSKKPEGRIDFLKEYFENDFDFTLHELTITYNNLVDPFDNQRYIEMYEIEKAVIMRALFTIESDDITTVLGLDLGDHAFYLYVAKTNESNNWQIIDMSPANPYK